MESDYKSKPYAEWVEETVKQMFERDPECIALQMLLPGGYIYTSYFNVAPDDMARFMGAMRDDERLEFIRNNRGLIAEILSADGDEEEEETEDEP